MRPIIISGAELCVNKISGIQRYMIETLKNIDKLLFENPQPFDVLLCYPQNKKLLISDFKSIKMVSLPYEGKKWNIKILKDYVIQKNGIFCGLGNNITLCKDSIILLHDVRRLETFKYDSFKSIINFWITCKFISFFSKIVVTVSEYQKKIICQKLHKANDDVKVFFAGYEHIISISEDESIFKLFPNIKKGDFYYAIGSIAKHKNYKWIYEIAKRNPNIQFIIAGNQIKEKWGTSSDEFILKNIIYIGYITDEQNKSLMKNCKVFLHPSYYEGFGLPPLEALVLGKPIMVSSSTCLPEIYNGIATIFNPDDYSIDLAKFHVPSSNEIELMKHQYSWAKVASNFIKLFQKCNEADV